MNSFTISSALIHLSDFPVKGEYSPVKGEQFCYFFSFNSYFHLSKKTLRISASVAAGEVEGRDAAAAAVWEKAAGQERLQTGGLGIV